MRRRWSARRDPPAGQSHRHVHRAARAAQGAGTPGRQAGGDPACATGLERPRATAGCPARPRHGMTRHNHEQADPMSDDLLSGAQAAPDSYSAPSIEVLEGLEPVRKRPGMYIGGTDERALHHLVAEILDNAMDEAVAGHASRIEVELHGDGSATIRDNGRGIPIDPHPKFPGKSALEVILCTLHAGRKFTEGG